MGPPSRSLTLFAGLQAQFFLSPPSENIQAAPAGVFSSAKMDRQVGKLATLGVSDPSGSITDKVKQFPIFLFRPQTFPKGWSQRIAAPLPLHPMSVAQAASGNFPIAFFDRAILVRQVNATAPNERVPVSRFPCSVHRAHRRPLYCWLNASFDPARFRHRSAPRHSKLSPSSRQPRPA